MADDYLVKISLRELREVASLLTDAVKYNDMAQDEVRMSRAITLANWFDGMANTLERPAVTKLPMPEEQYVSKWNGIDYVLTTSSGKIPLDTWRIIRWLNGLPTTKIRNIVKRVCKPLPVPIALSSYVPGDSRDDLITYLSCTSWRWYEIGMTVSNIESGYFQP